MTFIIKLVLIAVFCFLAQLFLPWWIVVVISFIVCAIIPGRGLNSFLSGFLGVGLLWLIYALIIDIQTDSILTAKVAGLFQLGKGAALVAVSGLVGAVSGGLGALSGYFFRQLF